MLGNHLISSLMVTVGNVRPCNDWDTLSRQGKNPPSLEIPGLGSDHQPVTHVWCGLFEPQLSRLKNKEGMILAQVVI